VKKREGRRYIQWGPGQVVWLAERHLPNAMRASRLRLIGVAGLSAFVLGRSADAQAPAGGLQLHGFANWGAGHSDGGSYEYASKRGYVDAGTFALIFDAVPAPNVTVVAQLGFNGLGHDVTEPKLDILFAQYTFSDALKFNIGRVKQPFGHYTEIFDVGTAHNMLALPHGVYDVSGMMGEVYNGVGLTGGVFQANGAWGLRYDGYVGDLTIVTRRPWEFDPSEHTRLFHEVLGGRVIVDTPISGLSLGVSGYTGHLDDSTDVDSGERHDVIAAQAEWLSGRYGMRAELATQSENGVRENAGYLEATLRLSEDTQLAGRYDASRASGEDALGAPSSLLRHSDIGGGVNFWVASGFVLRAEYHNVTGNRFISPLRVSPLGKRTNVLQFGSQFSF
jgi:hypothetical protein